MLCNMHTTSFNVAHHRLQNHDRSEQANSQDDGQVYYFFCKTIHSFMIGAKESKFVLSRLSILGEKYRLHFLNQF